MPNSKKYSRAELAAATKRVETVYLLSGYDAALELWRELKLPVVRIQQRFHLMSWDQHGYVGVSDVVLEAEFPLRFNRQRRRTTGGRERSRENTVGKPGKKRI